MHGSMLLFTISLSIAPVVMTLTMTMMQLRLGLSQCGHAVLTLHLTVHLAQLEQVVYTTICLCMLDSSCRRYSLLLCAD